MKKFDLNKPKRYYNWIESIAWIFFAIFLGVVNLLKELARTKKIIHSKEKNMKKFDLKEISYNWIELIISILFTIFWVFIDIVRILVGRKR